MAPRSPSCVSAAMPARTSTRRCTSFDAGATVDQLPLELLIGPAWVAAPGEAAVGDAAAGDAGAVTADLLERAGIPAGVERLLVKTQNSARMSRFLAQNTGVRIPFDESYVALDRSAGRMVARPGRAAGRHRRRLDRRLRRGGFSRAPLAAPCGRGRRGEPVPAGMSSPDPTGCFACRSIMRAATVRPPGSCWKPSEHLRSEHK